MLRPSPQGIHLREIRDLESSESEDESECGNALQRIVGPFFIFCYWNTSVIHIWSWKFLILYRSQRRVIKGHRIRGPEKLLMSIRKLFLSFWNIRKKEAKVIFNYHGKKDKITILEL